MRIQYLFCFIVILLFSGQLFSQEKQTCNIDFLVGTNPSDFSDNQIRDFLMTFDEECIDNAEYSEVSNGILFQLLDKQTKNVIEIMTNNSEEIALDYILEELTSPIDDRINPKELIEKINGVETQGPEKKLIIKKLKIAAENF